MLQLPLFVTVLAAAVLLAGFVVGMGWPALHRLRQLREQAECELRLLTHLLEHYYALLADIESGPAAAEQTTLLAAQHRAQRALRAVPQAGIYRRRAGQRLWGHHRRLLQAAKQSKHADCDCDTTTTSTASGSSTTGRTCSSPDGLQQLEWDIAATQLHFNDRLMLYNAFRTSGFAWLVSWLLGFEAAPVWTPFDTLHQVAPGVAHSRRFLPSA